MRIAIVATLLVACGGSARITPADPPLKHIEAYSEDEAIVELVEGVSAKSIVGAELFADFAPGWTPADAEARFGKPLEVLERDHATLFMYERNGRRIAIGRMTVLQSNGGSPGPSYDLRAFPPANYVDTMPKGLQQLIRSKPNLRSILFRSTAPGDWGLHLRVQDGRVSYVSAVPPRNPAPTK